jgi:diguanylate cyclase (GGDEF)-like protein
MIELPKEVQDRVTALAEEFVSGLPDRMREIRALFDQAESGNRTSLREMRLQVHRIAGSAATFDFEPLGEAARSLEMNVENDLACEERGPSRGTRESFELFHRQMNSAGRDRTDAAKDAGATADSANGGSATEGDETGESDRGTTTASADAFVVRYDRAVVLVGDVPGLPADFGEQVGVFRFVVSFAADIEGVGPFCDACLRPMDGSTDSDRDAYRYVVLVAAVDYFAAKPRRLKMLAEIRKKYGNQVVLILVGDEDDFMTRLRSVRYGAEAFLPTPIDTTEFVDRIDSLTANRSPDPFHVLIVDDDPEQVSNTALVLQDAGMITSVVTDASKIFNVLVEYRPELILLDMYMPDCTGAELASIVRQNENFVGIPIIFLSVETDQEKQFEAIQNGGDGFLVKPVDPRQLVATVNVRATRTRAMRFYMERDSLTGLLNHTNLKNQIEQELQRARRIGLSMVFAMIDMDHFKSVNDTYGHLTGDRVIKSLARLLQERLRRSDTIGRYGGEEFGVILFNTDASWAETIMNEIRESFARLRQSDGNKEFTVTLSCGIAEFPQYGSASELNEAADAALYRAKQAGRNRVVIASPEPDPGR